MLLQLLRRLSGREHDHASASAMPEFRLPSEPDAPWQDEALGQLYPVRRMVVLMRPRQPYVRWVQSLGEAGYNLGKAQRDDCLSFLIPAHEFEVDEA